MKLIDFYSKFQKLYKNSITSKSILVFLIIFLSTLKIQNKITVDNSPFHNFYDTKNNIEKYDENLQKFKNNLEKLRMMKQNLTKIKDNFLKFLLRNKEKKLEKQQPFDISENLEENHNLKYLIDYQNPRKNFTKIKNKTFLLNNNEDKDFADLKTNNENAAYESISQLIIGFNESSFESKSNTQFKTVEEVYDYFNTEILSLTYSLENVLNIDQNSYKDINKNAYSNLNLNQASDNIINNTDITLYSIPQEVHQDKDFDIITLKHFKAFFYESYSNTKDRKIIEFSIEGRIFIISSEEEFKALIVEMDKSEVEPKKIYHSKLILLFKNQNYAKKLIDTDLIYRYRIKFSAMLIAIDFDLENFNVKDFMNEYPQNLKKPVLLINANIFPEMNNLISKSNAIKNDVVIKIEYNNAKEFFDKDYLLPLNNILFFALVLLFIIWIIMSIIYKKFYNMLHKWFSALIVLKLFFTFIVICNLNIFFKENSFSDDSWVEDFQKILYETLLVSSNCIFKSFFLFLFFIIFEGFKIITDNLTRMQTKGLVCVFIVFYISSCIDQFLDFDVENKVGKFSISELKNFLFFLVYVILTQLKAKKSLNFLEKKLLYAKLFVSEYVEHIKIKRNYIYYCRIISPLLISVYFIFTLSFRLTNERDDIYTKHFILIHHNLIECIFIALLILPYIPRKFPDNFNDFIFDDLENLENINFYKVIIKRINSNDKQINLIDTNDSYVLKDFIHENSTNAINSSLEIISRADFDNCNLNKHKSQNSKNKMQQAVKIHSKEDNTKEIIKHLEDYSKLKQNFIELGIENQLIFKKNFPIVILNPGFENTNFPTEKICIGNLL